MATSHFEASRPVEGSLFVDRQRELDRLDSALDKLLAGRSAFLAVLGLRKLGKTSLFHEWIRRNSRRSEISFVPVQCWAWPDPDDFFREYLRLTINTALNARSLHSEVGLIPHGNDQGRLVEVAACAARAGLEGLGAALRLKADYDDMRNRASAYREVVRAPEAMAAQDGFRFQFILDEFQEVGRFDSFRAIKNGFGSVYAMLREEWLGQRHCNYMVSGSAVTLLRQIVEDPSAPFFQHFTTIHLGPLPEADAVELLCDFSKRSGRPIPVALCRTIVDTVGTNPYYLQVLGEELVLEATSDAATVEDWRTTCQRVVFETSGRLYQYFDRMHASVAGSSSMLAKILFALADGPRRGSEVAKAMGVTQNRISSKLPILEARDVVRKDGSAYCLCDPCYALWLRGARSETPSVIAPLVLGNESERRVAREMARQGVSLVYQSRASRGAFDLLALYQVYEIGVQVRRIKRFPAYISERMLGRMRREAEQLGWHAVLALDTGERVTFHCLTSGTLTKRGRSFREERALRHILDVLDTSE